MRATDEKKNSPQRSVLTEIRANRHELRKRGLTAADLLALESVAWVQSGRRRSVRCSEVARLTGVSRQAASRRLQRLEVLGAVFRVGGAVMLNIRGLLRWSADGIAARLEAARRRFLKKKAECVNGLLSHRERKEPLAESGGVLALTDPLLAVVGTIAENKAWLAAHYVAPHLRQCRG